MASLEQQTVDVTPVPTETSSEDQRFWQIGKSANECFLQIYSGHLWTDVSIRCYDQMAEDPDDRLRAHKLVLATRSPVFSAMFYGPNSEMNNEIHILDYSKESMDAFLRSLYNDCVCKTMDASVAIDVFKIAHLYQVSDIGEKCVAVLLEKLCTDNACILLEIAMFYEHTQLKENVLVFIDDNAEAVLKSESFLSISRDTLQFMLQGDTLFADETHIVAAVIQWGTSKLTDSNKDVNVTTLREVLGRAFCFLRMTAMTMNDFIKSENINRLHTHDECLRILNYFRTGDRREHTRLCHLPKKRVPRVVKTKYSRKNDHYVCDSNYEDRFKISSKENVAITHIHVKLPLIAIEMYAGRGRSLRYRMRDKMPYKLSTTCTDVRFHQTQTVVAMGRTQHELILDPPLLLEGSGVQVYTLKFEVSCEAFDGIDFELDSMYTEASNPAESSPSVRFNDNNLVQGFTFLHQSNRDINGNLELMGEATNALAINKTDNDDTDNGQASRKKRRTD